MMNIETLQDLERAKWLYLRALEGAASHEYKDHCLSKLAVIKREIARYFAEKERAA